MPGQPGQSVSSGHTHEFQGSVADRLRGWAPELALAVLAVAMFLGYLGAMDLWGKREQRAFAESIDTVDHQHWLVAEIQARPRLEKPPLPRWTSALLIELTGHRDQWLLRLPAALSALGMVGLVYGLGRRIGGRSVGLASGLALVSMLSFVVEMRQAGNDGPLALFTTLALYAAWRRLHGGPADEAPGLPADVPGERRWAVVLGAALGLGFLCKGPVALVLVLIAVVPYLLGTGRLKPGARLLVSGWGMLVMLALALSWPVPVALSDPNAVGVWLLEMGQKAGSAGVTHHRKRDVLATEWPGMTAPWTVIALIGLALPFRKGLNLAYRPALWLPWWWAMGNLAMFCLWSVAKPNYYIPCLPGVALLVGAAWVQICQQARLASGVQASRLLQGHWVVLFVAALVGPVVVGQMWPEFLGWSLAAALVLALGVVASAWAWRRGADAGALAPLVAALTTLMLIGYGAITPRLNARNSHRALATTLNRLLPPEAGVVMFYRQLDEGLWYYLRNRQLRPVPGSQPRYNSGFDLLEDYKKGKMVWNEAERTRQSLGLLADWIRQEEHESPYLLIRAEYYDIFAREFPGLVTPLYREPDLDRNELILVRVGAATPAATAPAAVAEGQDAVPQRR